MNDHDPILPGTGVALLRSTGPLENAATARTIVVNGRHHRYVGDEIGVDELATMAWPGRRDGGRSTLTVAWEGGPVQASSGLLPASGTTPVAEGQIFSVALTDKS